MKKIVFVLFAIACIGCSRQEGPATSLKAYFDLDSLLDSQIKALSTRQAAVSKEVTMDGANESQRLQPDSSGWDAEFTIIRDFNLNKSHYVGAYQVQDSAGYIVYTLVDDIDAPVRSFEILKKQGSVVSIASDYFEDKSIYQHRRKLQLHFDEGLLKTYEIKGYQKMILKDTIRYRISGTIDIP